MIILGIDPGLATMGYGVIEANAGRHRLQSSNRAIIRVANFFIMIILSFLNFWNCFLLLGFLDRDQSVNERRSTPASFPAYASIRILSPAMPASAWHRKGYRVIGLASLW